jgi:hypothetical protein
MPLHIGFLHIRFCLLPLALATACLLPAVQAKADDIHVCIDAEGMKSYQNAPCAQGQRTLSVRSYETKPEDPALTARTAAIQQEMDRRNRPGGKTTAMRSTVSRRPTGPTPCQAAKAKREATLKRVGLKRTYDLLSQLDSEVWEVCKGF